jgi:hypothetical protein
MHFKTANAAAMLDAVIRSRSCVRAFLPDPVPRQEYRRRAQHLLQMAKTCRDAQIAARLRIIAADYFDASGQAQRKAS